MLGLVTRPLLIIFLTIFVNLVGFGIIIPLLPFYAETFGASPLVIGLLFAIFLTKPSPFCFLDEVDAPLDDANIDRFIEIVKEMSEHSQFVLVTHNKKSMQAAEVLYGITMAEPGVSKVVSVRMH